MRLCAGHSQPGRATAGGRTRARSGAPGTGAAGRPLAGTRCRGAAQRSPPAAARRGSASPGTSAGWHGTAHGRAHRPAARQRLPRRQSTRASGPHAGRAGAMHPRGTFPNCHGNGQRKCAPARQPACCSTARASSPRPPHRRRAPAAQRRTHLQAKVQLKRLGYQSDQE